MSEGFLKQLFQGKIPNQNYHNNVSESHLIVSKSKLQGCQCQLPLNVCFHSFLWSSNAVFSFLQSQSNIQGNLCHLVHTMYDLRGSAFQNFLFRICKISSISSWKQICLKSILEYSRTGLTSK